MKDFVTSLNFLDDRAKRLNAAWLLVDSVVAKIHDRLSAAELPVTASTEPFATETVFHEGHSWREERRLGRGKINGQFRFYVATDRECMTSDEYRRTSESMPWEDVSREVRLMAIVALPELLVKLIEKADALLAAVEKAEPTLRRIGEGLGSEASS